MMNCAIVTNTDETAGVSRRFFIVYMLIKCILYGLLYKANKGGKKGDYMNYDIGIYQRLLKGF